MNCHRHDFSGFSSMPTVIRGNQAMSEIVHQHDVTQPLTTGYQGPIHVTAEQRQQQERASAMAKAAALTVFHGGTSLPIARPVPHPPTAVVTRVPARRPGTANEPDCLALNGSFRKSSSSLLSIEGDLYTNGEVPPPPPLKTDVTTLLLTPTNADVSSNPPEVNAETTELATKSKPKLKLPLKNQKPRRLSNLLSAIMPTQKNQRKGRASRQAQDSATPSVSSTAIPPVIPKRPPPSLYPTVACTNTLLTNHMSDEDRIRANDDEPLFAGAAIVSQAQLLEQFNSSWEPTTKPTATTADTRAVTIEEQGQLWHQLSNSHSSFQTATTVASSTVSLSPIQEQAKLWDQITQQRVHHNNSISTLESCSSFARMDPLEEQARLLEACQRKKPTAAQLLAVAEQARLLRACQPPPQLVPLDPIEQQAKRLRELQDAKEQKIMEMACQLSQTLPPVVPDRRDEEELSLQYIMAMSRLEADEHNRKRQDLEGAVLREALNRSEQEMYLGLSLQDQLLHESSGFDYYDQQQSVDLELRRSIAELACQTSDRTVDSAAAGGRKSVGLVDLAQRYR